MIGDRHKYPTAQQLNRADNLVGPHVSGLGDRMAEVPKAMCCFCGEYAPTGSDDFFSLLVRLPDDASQELWAHGKCLRRAVHPSVPMLLSEEE